MSFHVGDIAYPGIQNGCCGIGHSQARCCSIQFECRGIQRPTDTVACISSARTLKNCHLILEQAFKVIPLGEVSYKSLVSAKNNKHTSLNQNLDNWKWFPNLCQNRGANTAANSKNHNYFYTNLNWVIQKPKLHLRKSSFWEKYHKNANPYASNPET